MNEQVLPTYMEQPVISLIIVNYRSAARLREALSTWEVPLRKLSHEFVIVNNDENERAALDALSQESGVRVLHQAENVGFARAANVGARAARGEVCFFLNPDASYASGSVEDLAAACRAFPRTVVGARLVDALGRDEEWSSGRFPTLGRLLAQNILGIGKRPTSIVRRMKATDWVSGAALALSRDGFFELGGFDENFFLYFEDVDLAQRAKARGFQVWRHGRLLVKHIGGASHENTRQQKAYYYTSQERYFAKHRPKWEQHCLRWLHRAWLGRASFES